MSGNFLWNRIVMVNNTNICNCNLASFLECQLITMRQFFFLFIDINQDCWKMKRKSAGINLKCHMWISFIYFFMPYFVILPLPFYIFLSPIFYSQKQLVSNGIVIWWYIICPHNNKILTLIPGEQVDRRICIV